MLRVARAVPLLIAIWTAGCAGPLTTQSSAAPLALRGLDPVALCNGVERAGSLEWTIDHGRYRYCFSEDASLQTFRSSPNRYAIQWDGACARMGPLSGRGSAERFLVYDRKIYLFASDACRNAFAKSPDRYVAGPQSPLNPLDEEVAAGWQALMAAVRFHGGERRILGWSTLRLRTRVEAKDGDSTRIDTTCVTIAPPDRIRFEQTYGDWRFTYIRNGALGIAIGNRGDIEPIGVDALRELTIDHMGHPLCWLRAALDHTCSVAAHRHTKHNDDNGQIVLLERDGHRAELLIAGSGEILEIRSTRRGPNMQLQRVVETFSDYREQHGLRIAHRVDATYSEKPSAPRLYESVVVDGPIEDSTFSVARRAP